MAARTPRLVPNRAGGSATSRAPSLQRREEKHCANCLAEEQPGSALMTCHQCRGILYCSERCAQECLNRHRKLCYKFMTTKEPEVPNQARAVLFAVRKQKPEVIFIDANQWEARAEEVVCAVPVEPLPAPLVIFTITINPITGRRLPFDLKIVSRACINPINTAIGWCFNDNWELPAPRFPWTGSVAAVRVNSATGVAESITMADFKNVLEFFVWYAYQFTPEMYCYSDNFSIAPVAAPIRGVVIRCAAMESLHPDDGAFVSTMVDHLHPIRGLHISAMLKLGDVSPLSEKARHLLRVYQMPNPPLETNKGRWECLPGDKTNGRASELMLKIPDHQEHLSLAEIDDAFPKVQGDVLVVREDGQDLDIVDVEAMCLEARNWSAIKGQGRRCFIHPASYQETLRRQQTEPIKLTNLSASGFAAFNIDVAGTAIDPSLGAATPAAAGDGGNGPIEMMAPEQTLPSLWTKVKLDGVVTFEGFSFPTMSAPAAAPAADEPESSGLHTSGEQPAHQKQSTYPQPPVLVEQPGYEEQAAPLEGPTSLGQTEHLEQPTYPEPPPQTYTYSMQLREEEDAPLFSPQI